MALTEKLTAIADAIRTQSGKTDLLTLDQMPPEIIDLQSLNFEVAGNPQPENPKENTIWIDTDMEITSWVFAAQQPETATEGMVWIAIGTSGSGAFNALKENALMVYPMSAKQYTNGAWVEKPAAIYGSDGWEGLRLNLYKDGNQYTAITGGWATMSQNNSTATVNSNNITINATGKTNTDTLCSVYTKNKIDVTHYKTLQINSDWVTSMSGSGAYPRFGLYRDKPTSFAITGAPVAQIFENAYRVDVSKITGSYYVGMLASVGGVSSYYANLKATEVWLA